MSVVLLSGGSGGAKLARGLYDLLGDELAVIANTGDDIEIYGAYVSPDPDLVSYWLADRIDERGWGIDGVKLRALFAVPKADDRRFFYGANFEFSYNADRKSTRLNSSHLKLSRMPSSA